MYEGGYGHQQGPHEDSNMYVKDIRTRKVDKHHEVAAHRHTPLMQTNHLQVWDTCPKSKLSIVVEKEEI
jgi:hypothetical protein